jgi:hypothetical protein
MRSSLLEILDVRVSLRGLSSFDQSSLLKSVATLSRETLGMHGDRLLEE